MPSKNLLRREKSAYLLQHAENPVHWMPFGKDAFEKARNENKPIFLSVGYSSCHWCHVMAHESFEDEQTADYLNKNFVSIKVDREEHPDVDAYYQMACQLYSQAGGWPLSAFLMPDTRPFFAGTYFPKSPSHGRPSFLQLLEELNRAWKDENDKIETNATEITEAISKFHDHDQKVEFQGHFPHPMGILEAVAQLKDEENGGYGQAPKFPQFAWYEWAVEQILEGMVDQEKGQHIVRSIEMMLMGGINDHIRGGIHRYSVDEKWMVPHFEKMLYDQAGLLRVLSKISLVYPSPLVFDTIMNTLDYLEKEMLHDEGYFFSAQDADSEGREGLYFTFTKSEFLQALEDTEDQQILAQREKFLEWFQMEDRGNFEDDLSVISLDKSKAQDICEPASWDQIRKIRKALLDQRKQRIPPTTDTKGICSWNFMMISSLIDVMQYCRVNPIKHRANELFHKVLEGCYKTFIIEKDQESMKLLHSTTLPAGVPLLEDYTFFGEAMLRTWEVTGNPVFKENALETLKLISEDFMDADRVMTRAKSFDEHVDYPNQQFSAFDSSFRSPATSLCALVRRASVLFPDEKDLWDSWQDIFERFIHESLRNPLGCGEGLRAFSYPEQAYKVLKVPKSWLKENEFVSFMPYFMPRFVFDYQDSDDQRWEICRSDACEVNGDGLKDFIETMRPKAPEGEQQS